MSASSRSQPLSPECDVVVLGGGPAGAAAANTLARGGLSVVVIEGSRYERARIGETLPPSAQPWLGQLDVWPAFAAAGHLPSPGVLSVWGNGDLCEHPHILNPRGHGWHLDRRRFDTMLIDAARLAGAEVHFGAELDSCQWCGAGGWHARVARGAGEPRQFDHVHARAVIDATGRAAVFARQQGARRVNADRLIGLAAVLDAGARRAACGDDECGACTLVEAGAEGWWYSAPLPGGRTIAVFMTDADVLTRSRRCRFDFWHVQLQQTVHTQVRLEGRTLDAVPHVVAATSSRLDRACGDGWVAVGDAVMAFDPLSSQGLVHALASGIRAADALSCYLRGDSAAIDEYEVSVDRGFREYSRLRAVYYGLEQRWPTSAFWRRRH